MIKSTVRNCLWDYTIGDAELQPVITGSDMKKNNGFLTALCTIRRIKLMKSIPIKESLIGTICRDIHQKNTNSVFGIKYE